MNEKILLNMLMILYKISSKNDLFLLLLSFLFQNSIVRTWIWKRPKDKVDDEPRHCKTDDGDHLPGKREFL